MKKLFILVFGVFSLTCVAQTKNFIDQPYLETRVSVDTLVSPDQIYMSILVSEKDTKGKISVEELENKMATQLKSLGINLDKQLKISDLTSNFRKYFLKGQDVLKAKAYTLLVYDGLTAGKVLVALEKLEISNVNIEKTGYSKMDKLLSHLKAKTILKAKKDAELIVSAVNQNLGKIIYVSDMNIFNSNVLQGRVAGIQMDYSAKKEYEPIEIQFDQIKVQTTLQVNFIIE